LADANQGLSESAIVKTMRGYAKEFGCEFATNRPLHDAMQVPMSASAFLLPKAALPLTAISCHSWHQIECRLLARRRPAREHTRIPVIGVMQTKYARPDFFRTTALKFQLD